MLRGKLTLHLGVGIDLGQIVLNVNLLKINTNDISKSEAYSDNSKEQKVPVSIALLASLVVSSLNLLLVADH